MFSHRNLLRAARLTLGVLLLAQGALALVACDWGARDAARAVAMASGSEDAPCHESSAAGAKSGLCLSHCLGDKQSLDKHAGTLAALAPCSLVVIVAPVSAILPWHQAWRDRPLPAAAPPLRILFQSFQT